MKKMNKEQIEEVIFIAVLFIISLVFVIQAFSFKRQAAFMPLVIGIPFALSAGVLLYRMLKTDFFDTEQGKKKKDAPSLKDEAKIWIWVFCLLIGVILFGIVPAGFIFILLFLIFVAGFKWYRSLIYSVCSMGVIYLMFTVMLSLRLFQGILFS